MKNRHNTDFRVLYDLSGRHQEDILQYQGFQQVAVREGWEVITVSEQVESQIRRLSSRRLVDAVVANFISETWRSTLPPEVILLHVGPTPLGKTNPAVCWNFRIIGQQLKTHLDQMGYKQTVVFSPQDQPELRRGAGAELQMKTRESLREFLQNRSQLAVVCPSDYEARLALRTAQLAQRSVPDQLGIAGVGGRSLDAVLTDVSLTSVALPWEEKGRRAGDLLLRLANGADPEIVHIAPRGVLPGDSTRREKGRPSLKDQVDALLLKDLRSPPPVEDWARRCGMSRRGYERAFAAEVGTTPYDYLLQLREQEAKRLLCETDWNLARIGDIIGIPDPPRFSAFFRKRVGTSASEWRKQHA